MRHSESYLVTKENGPRPAGNPDECYYCKQKIGTEHRADCVCRKRTILIEATMLILQDIPEAWDESDIDTYYNESSSCSNNLVDNRYEDCLCPWTRVKYMREANIEDEKEHSYINRRG